ncbi:hypothetical protein ABVK25_003944 [Lepraria finkii]|uniref:N-acetyltransferase domain-containing protein n=1 Tax=Lepraria finkii TaxID=1340010 RepID=A0ABR4BD28_9LECA
MPEGTNTTLMHDFEAETQRMRNEYVNSEEDYVLRATATLPEYQGRGCASALLKAGLEKVDAEGRKVFLEATPQGHPLYIKFGWIDVDKMAFDLKNGSLKSKLDTSLPPKDLTPDGFKERKAQALLSVLSHVCGLRRNFDHAVI